MTDHAIERAHHRAGTLTDREKDVLRRRFGIGCPKHTYGEVAGAYGLTKTRIRMIQNKAIRNIVGKAVQ
jgi:DNA-directed RNA polymerase sigma subunit (sigma70/sigma32)